MNCLIVSREGMGESLQHIIRKNAPHAGIALTSSIEKAGQIAAKWKADILILVLKQVGRITEERKVMLEKFNLPTLVFCDDVQLIVSAGFWEWSPGFEALPEPMENDLCAPYFRDLLANTLENLSKSSSKDEVVA